MNNRRTARYAVAGTTTLLLAGAVARTYAEMGSDPEPNDLRKVQKSLLGAVTLGTLTWLTALL